MAIQIMALPNPHSNLSLRVAKGHFATSHSHINYYLDLTMTKCRLSEAREAAIELASTFKSSTVIDTILCLDGTEVIGACMASELTKAGYISMNQHKTIYVVTPEHSGSQLIFRENIAPMIVGKHVLILAASVTTGFTVKGATEAIRYYSGMTEGVCSVFASVKECEGFPVHTIFTPDNVDGYASYDSNDCPMCRSGQRLDGIVNTYGISSFNY